MLSIQDFHSLVEETLQQSGSAKDCNPQGQPFYSWTASASHDSVAYSPGNPSFDGGDWLYIGLKDCDFVMSTGYGTTLDEAITSAKKPF